MRKIQIAIAIIASALRAREWVVVFDYGVVNYEYTDFSLYMRAVRGGL